MTTTSFVYHARVSTTKSSKMPRALELSPAKNDEFESSEIKIKITQLYTSSNFKSV